MSVGDTVGPIMTMASIKSSGQLASVMLMTYFSYKSGINDFCFWKKYGRNLKLTFVALLRVINDEDEHSSVDSSRLPQTYLLLMLLWSLSVACESNPLRSHIPLLLSNTAALVVPYRVYPFPKC